MMLKYIFSIITVAISINSWGQISSLQKGIETIIQGKDIEVGVALYDISNGDTLTINGDRKFPMQSVFKFHIALSLLSEVDKGRWKLDDKIFITKKELNPDLWSPIREKYPNGDVSLPLSEIVRYTVSQSDNSGCDIQLSMLGGAPVVNKYLHNIGIEDINIIHNEQTMQSCWDNQFDNWTTPKACIELLKKFHNKQLLKPETQGFLSRIMEETVTGSIKGKLPKEAIVAHKTGTSGYNSDNVSAATNDIGIMTLPSGKHILYAIFITNSKEKQEINYSIISEIGALLYFCGL